MLSGEQASIINVLENTNRSLFITGRAGTGKSHLLKMFMDRTNKNVALLAPTGVAALNVRGQTINSFFRIFKDGIYYPEDFKEQVQNSSSYYKEMIKSLDTIVIDEISMVRVDIFYTIDTICRLIRNNQTPFGGIQVVLVGDLYQLPPVIPKKEIKKELDSVYSGSYFFMSPKITELVMICHLKQIFRQDEEDFKMLLNNIRDGSNLVPTLNELNKRVIKPESMDGVIVLASKNEDVDDYNNERLDEIKEPEFTYKALITGKVSESAYPTDELLRLKKGSQVMMLNNDPTKRWVNGTVGIVSKLTKDAIYVKIKEEEYSIPKKTWESVKYKYVQGKLQTEVEGLFIQYPIRLAWAVTIHKSQGQTYDSVYLKMKSAFDYGQTYVALSRCKSLKTLYLENPLKESDVRIDNKVKSFMGNNSH